MGDRFGDGYAAGLGIYFGDTVGDLLGLCCSCLGDCYSLFLGDSKFGYFGVSVVSILMERIRLNIAFSQ